MTVITRPRTARRKSARNASRRMLVESLEDRHLLAVTFDFNFIGGNATGFNDPVQGAEFRSALNSAAGRLGGWLLADAAIQLDVVSSPFAGTGVASARSELPPPPPGGGFVDTIVAAKVKGQGDSNGSSADGQLEVFFFSPSDPFRYVTDPAAVDADEEIDFQAVAIHELAHTLGFTSATTADGSDDSGAGITSPGTWRPFDRFLSDATGNRLIDADPNSPTAFRMNTAPSGWPTVSVGGKGPDAGLFFDGPIATAVYGSRVPLYSPQTFSLISSVGHLDSEGAIANDPIFSPLTHLMSHAIIGNAVPQEFTLVEKAIFADMGILLREDTLPLITTPADITLEGNSIGGFSGSNASLEDFLAGATATDLFDSNLVIANDAGDFLPLGQNTITFTASDASGNQSTASAIVEVVDTTPPQFNLPTTLAISANVPAGADLTHPILTDLFSSSATDTVDSSLTFSASLTTIPVGITSVSFAATDDSGNASTRSVIVTVSDSSFTVTTLDDELDVDPLSDPSDLSLREAIRLANANAGFDAIFFDNALNGSILMDASLGQLQVTETVSIIGPGSENVTLDAQGNSRVLDMTASSGDVLIEGLTISGGRAVGDDETGAGIRFQSSGKLTVNDSVISGNATLGLAAAGGGIQVSGGDLLLTGTTISGNSTGGEFSSGGGVWVGAGDVTVVRSIITGNQTTADLSFGGGLYVLDGTTTISQSTIANNHTEGVRSGGGGVVLLSNAAVIRDSTISGNFTEGPNTGGGGLRAVLATVDLINSTISGNRVSTVSGISGGGGIYASGTTLNVDNSTITSNQATGAGGGIGIPADVQGTALTLENSIVAGNVDDGTAPDFFGSAAIVPVGSVRFSLIGDGTGTSLDASLTPDPISGNLVGDSAGVGVIDPLLGPLADNGGPTPTHAPDSASPAIDAGDPLLNRTVFTPPLIGDQRGDSFPRISGAAVDIGALETIAGVTIRWSDPADITFGTPLGDGQLNATTNVPGTLVYTPPAGTLLNAGEAQTLSVVFTPDDTDMFAVTTATTFINVLRADPTINWDTPEAISFGTALDQMQLNATADVSGTLQYSPPPGTVLDAGTNQVLSVTFTPDDTQNYNSVTKSVLIDVLQEDPVITWNDPDPITFGTPLSAAQLNATANVAGTFSYSPPAGVFLTAGQDRTLTVTFIPEDLDNYSLVATTVQIDVLKADPIVVWENPGDVVVGTALSATQLNATSPNLGSFQYSPAAGTVLAVGAQQSLSAVFTPVDTGNFNSITATVQINVIDIQDFGDAPEAYPVTLADNGARHETTTLFLGAGVDDDLDGQPSPLADGDGDDDDGIRMTADLLAVAGSSTTSSIIATASEAGKLDAWIDFNQDGDWEDSGEQILASFDVAAGDQPISYTIPAGAMVGTTAARFRLSTAGGLAATGPATDGEVEDYLVTLLDGSQSPAVSVDVVDRHITIDIGSENLVARSGNTDLFAAPVANVGPLGVLGTILDEVVTLQLAVGSVTPPGGLDLRGGLGNDSLVFSGEGGTYDLTDPMIVVSNFAELDLSSGDATGVIVDAATVSSLSPVARTVFVTAGLEDQLTVADAPQWLMTDPINVNGRFVRTATRQSGENEVIQLESPSHWQNFLQHGDINNDGIVSAVDALRIINELGRRSFSDPQTRVLVDATGISSWPGIYFDHNGDGRASALDALRVINDLSRQSLSRSGGEAVAIVPDQAGATVAISQGQGRSRDDPTASRSQPLLVTSVESIDESSAALRHAASSGADEKEGVGVGAASAAKRHASPPRSTASNVDSLLADTVFLSGLLD